MATVGWDLPISTSAYAALLRTTSFIASQSLDERVDESAAIACGDCWVGLADLTRTVLMLRYDAQRTVLSPVRALTSALMRAPPLPEATVGWDLHISPSASAALSRTLIASQSLDERVDEGPPLPVATLAFCCS